MRRYTVEIEKPSHIYDRRSRTRAFVGARRYTVEIEKPSHIYDRRSRSRAYVGAP